MTTRWLVTTTILGGLLLGITPAHATFMLSLESGGMTEAVEDSDGDGLLSFNGSLATSTWFVNVTTGISKPILGTEKVAKLDLNSIDVSGSAGTLQISLVDTDYNALSTSGFDYGLFNVGGTTDGSVAFEVYIDDANDLNPFDGIEVYSGSFGTGAFSDSVAPYTARLGSITDAFSMGIRATITHTNGGQVTSFDGDVKAVPEPTTLALVGIGLAGIGFARGRRLKT